MTTHVLDDEDASPANGDDTIEEVSLPEGRTFEELFGDGEEDSSTEAGDTKPATEESAAAAPAAAPAEKPEKKTPPDKKGDVRVALKKEREEKKELKQRLEKATSPNIWERIEAQRQEAKLRSGPASRQRATAPEVKFDRTKARAEAVEAASRGAATADTFDATARATAEAVTEVALSHAETLFKNWQESYLRTLDYQRQLDQETELREDLADEGEDYDEIIAKSGLLPMIQTDEQGRPRDPAAFNKDVYQLVYGSANPPKRALKLARQRLDFLEQQKHPPAQADDETSTSIVPGAAAEAAEPRRTAKADPAEARREGARQAIERVNEHATRPSGIRKYAKAGEPTRVHLDDALRRRLDRMANEDPEGLAEFCERNPKIADWWERGA